MVKAFSFILIAIMLSSAHAAEPDPEKMSFKGFLWPNQTPGECPFEQSFQFSGLYFTGINSDYYCGDTFYPTWAANGNLYSPFTDGITDGIHAGSWHPKETTGNVVMKGDDPQHLSIKNTSRPQKAAAYPYGGRYPCGSLMHDGVWYFGTYCLGITPTTIEDGYSFGWPILGPMPGFRISTDYGKTWTDSPLTPEKPLFPEPAEFLGPVKIGAPHFVDYGKNMEHSPDGKAYMVCMGAELNDPMPRYANLSWVAADQVYLIRVTPSPEAINDINAYEFFAGHKGDGTALWTRDFNKIKPLLEWNNHMGCVTATYNAPLKKYFMCVTDGWRTRSNMDSYILESDQLTGPWKMVTYMQEFGTQGYFLNFPSKFISEDGKTMWLCYSGNYGAHRKLPRNPPHGRYGLSLYEVRLLGEDKQQFMASKDWNKGQNRAAKATITTSSNSPSDNLVNGKVCQHDKNISDHWIDDSGNEESWIQLTWDEPQKLSGIKISDCSMRKDREKSGRLVFSNGHVIAFRMPQPGSNFEGLNIRWSNKKTVTWIKVVFDRIKPADAAPSASEIAIF